MLAGEEAPPPYVSLMLKQDCLTHPLSRLSQDSRPKSRPLRDGRLVAPARDTHNAFHQVRICYTTLLSLRRGLHPGGEVQGRTVDDLRAELFLEVLQKRMGGKFFT